MICTLIYILSSSYNKSIADREENKMRPAAENIAVEVVIDCFSSFLIGVSIVFAQQANFAPGGITGMGLILNLLTG